jgi:hypothetical protein
LVGLLSKTAKKQRLMMLKSSFPKTSSGLSGHSSQQRGEHLERAACWMVKVREPRALRVNQAKERLSSSCVLLVIHRKPRPHYCLALLLAVCSCCFSCPVSSETRGLNLIQGGALQTTLPT